MHSNTYNRVIEKAKEKLSTTELSVNEIVYELGFEHPQSFSKLFKNQNQSFAIRIQTIIQLTEHYCYDNICFKSSGSQMH